MLPQCKPVINRFHISQQLHTQVDEARNHIRKYGNKDEVFKIRWSILKNIEDPTVEEYNNLTLALSKYSKLEELHYLKEEFREFFRRNTMDNAAAFIEYYKALVE